MKTLTIILALNTTDYCPTHEPCALIEDKTIVMQSRHLFLNEVFFVKFDPETVDWPAYGSNDPVLNRRCAEQILGDLAWTKIHWNDLKTVCHETRHVLHGKGHYR